MRISDMGAHIPHRYRYMMAPGQTDDDFEREAMGPYYGMGQVPWTPPVLQMSTPLAPPPMPILPPASTFVQNALFQVPVASTVPLDQFTDDDLKGQRKSAQQKLDTNNFLLRNPKLSKLDISTIAAISRTMQANIDRIDAAMKLRHPEGADKKDAADEEARTQAMIRAAESSGGVGWLIPGVIGAGVLAIGLLWWASRD
jgi:hypothetical protein